MIEEQVLNGKTGATFGWIGSNIGKWLDTMKERDTTFDLIGVPFPAPNPGEVSSFNTANLETNGYGAAITTSCKNPELAVKVLEYAYSPEGWMFSNFGIEGISYTQEDGNPQYTETIKQNDEGKTMLEMMTLYTRANIPAPMVQDYRYTQQYLSIYPSQRQTQEYWSRGDNSSNKLPVPVDHITHWNGEDMTSVEEEIQQYADTMFVKFVLGLEPIEHFEEYVQHIKTLGIDALLQLKQQAYEQYLQN